MRFREYVTLRCQPDAQKETRDICWNIDQLANVSFPVSWEALRGELKEEKNLRMVKKGEGGGVPTPVSKLDDTELSLSVKVVDMSL